jgi:ribosomal protein S18 acetylase RimI-like enzyme
MYLWLVYMEIIEYNRRWYEKVIAFWKNIGLSAPESDTPERFEAMRKQNPSLLLLAIEGDRLIGTVFGGSDGRRGHIYSLGVDPEFRHKKIATILMEEVIRRFQAIGIVKIRGFVNKSNESVVQFYQRFGAKIKDDLIVMNLDLDKR